MARPLGKIILQAHGWEVRMLLPKRVSKVAVNLYGEVSTQK